MSPEQTPGPALIVHLQSRHQIETQEDQVHEIILAERFGIQVGVNAAQAAETAAMPAAGGQFRNEYGTMVSHNHPLDFSTTVD